MIDSRPWAAWPSQAGRQVRSAKAVRHLQRPVSVQNTEHGVVRVGPELPVEAVG